MNKFSKLPAIALVMVFAAVFAACGPKAAPFDADAAFSKLLSDVKYAQTLEDASAYVEYTIGDLPEGTEAKVFTAGGKYADCAMLFKVKDAADLDAVEAAVRGYLDSIKDEANHYDPEQVPKIEKAIVMRNGTSLIVCVTDDLEAANAILR